jgi:hypothetical protein
MCRLLWSRLRRSGGRNRRCRSGVVAIEQERASDEEGGDQCRNRPDENEEAGLIRKREGHVRLIGSRTSGLYGFLQENSVKLGTEDWAATKRDPVTTNGRRERKTTVHGWIARTSNARVRVKPGRRTSGR